MLPACRGVNVLRNEKVIPKAGDFSPERIGFKHFFHVYTSVRSTAVIPRTALIWTTSIGLGVISFVAPVELRQTFHFLFSVTGYSKKQILLTQDVQEAWHLNL